MSRIQETPANAFTATTGWPLNTAGAPIHYSSQLLSLIFLDHITTKYLTFFHGMPRALFNAARRINRSQQSPPTWNSDFTGRTVAESELTKWSDKKQVDKSPSYLNNTQLNITLGPGFGLNYVFLGGNAPQHQINLNLPSVNITAAPPGITGGALNANWYQLNYGDYRDLAHAMDYFKVVLTYCVYFADQCQNLNTNQLGLFNNPNAVHPYGINNFKDSPVYHNLFSSAFSETSYEYLTQPRRGRSSMIGLEGFRTGIINFGAGRHTFFFASNGGGGPSLGIQALAAGALGAGNYVRTLISQIVNRSLAFGLIIPPYSEKGFIFANASGNQGYPLQRLRKLKDPFFAFSAVSAPPATGGTLYFDVANQILLNKSQSVWRPKIHDFEGRPVWDKDIQTDTGINNQGRIFASNTTNFFLETAPTSFDELSRVSRCSYKTKLILEYLWSFINAGAGGFSNFLNAANDPEEIVGTLPSMPAALSLAPANPTQVNHWVEYWKYLKLRYDFIHGKAINDDSKRDFFFDA